jgi:type I restriction enzyme, S subunit
LSEQWPLPCAWTWVQLSEVAKVVGGGTPATSIAGNFGSDVPWVTPADLSTHKGKFIAGGARSLSAAGLATSGARWLPAGAVLFSSRAPIGYCAVAAQPLTTNQGFKSFVPEAGVRSDYLFYWLRSAKSMAEELASGTTFLELSGTKAATIPFPLAPEREQQRIVELLEELLDGVEEAEAELKRALSKLTVYRQSLLKSAVEGELTADWRRDNAPQESGSTLLARALSERRARWEASQLARYKADGKPPPNGWRSRYIEPVDPVTTGLPPLPSAWARASLDMLGEIASGVAKGGKHAEGSVLREVAYLRVANVQRGYLDLTEVKTLCASEKDIADLALQHGDVLFNEGGDRDKLGRGWVWQGELPLCIHQNHVFRMRPFIAAIAPEFVSHHGNTFGRRWFEAAGKQTTNLASINLSMLRAFPVPVPPADEQKRIVAMVGQHLESMEEQAQAIDRALALAAAQRQKILRAAFSGRLVPQDPNDEPASVLLERVRAERAQPLSSRPKPGARQRARKKSPPC